LPAGITGFSTMSSMAALPINIDSAEKSTRDPDTVRAVIPASTNIHMLGDSIIVPVLALAILVTFGKPLPDLSVFTIFVGYCLIAKLAIAGVPGGGILNMMPLLEQYMGFNSEMSSLIYTLYVLFDPVDTAANVFGNNSFSIIMSRLFNWNKQEVIPKK
jgi:Na+/H+-dicarboxylate symporter